MKTKQFLLPLVAVIVLASCAGINDRVKVRVSLQAESPQTKTGSSQTEQLYREVNSYRSSKGASELQRHAGLEQLAQEHCEYLRKNRGTFDVYGKNVSHMGDVGRSLIAIRVYEMMNSCENVAWTEKAGSGQQNAARMVAMWRESPDHDWAMSSDSWTHTGLATVVDSDGSVFATQLFCARNNSNVAWMDRFKGY